MNELIEYAGCDGFDEHTLAELMVQVWLSDHRSTTMGFNIH